MTDALRVYYGGFLKASMSPLGLDFGHCGRCVYCFSDLSGQAKVNIKQAMALLANYRDRETLVGKLLQEKYPVMISGTSDPFTPQHAKVSLPIIEVLSELGIRVEIATKGGAAAYTALEIIPNKSHWYISLALWDDKIRERIEPYAPTVKERLDLVETLAAAGNIVTVGISPILADWLPDNHPELLVKELKSRGVHGCRVQLMHLSPKHKKNLSKDWLSRITADELAKGSQAFRYPEQAAMYSRIKDLVLEHGIRFIDTQIKESSDYYEAIADLYPKRFPVMQEFVNWCHITKDNGDVVTWEEFRDFFVPRLPKGRHFLFDYIYSSTSVNTNKQVFTHQKQIFESLLKTIWRTPSIVTSPCNTDCFGIAGVVKESGGYTEIVNKDRMPYLIFSPEGYPNAVAECELIA